MWELRWVLLGLGGLLIAGIYFWGRYGAIRRARSGSATESGEPRRTEPTISQSNGPERETKRRAVIEPRIASFTEVPTDTLVEGADVPDSEASVSKSTDLSGELPVRTATTDEPKGDEPKGEAMAEVKPELAARESLSADAPDRVIALRFVARKDAINTQVAILALRELGLQHGRYGIFHRNPEGEDETAGFSVANLTEPGSFDLASAADSTLPGMTFFMVLPGVGDPVARFDDMVRTARALAQKLEADLLDDRGSSWSIQRERYIREEIILYRHQHGFGALRG
jgi:cell division protein ZipA